MYAAEPTVERYAPGARKRNPLLVSSSASSSIL